MMNFIKYLDFFSIKFNFYTNNQPNYQNTFGGIMSIIYILCCIGIFILFSYDDLFGLNPITSMSEIPESKSNIVNMNEEKIWIPFRIVTENKKFIDHRDILNIFPYYVEGNYNEKIGMDLKFRLLNYKLCNETSMINNTDHFKIDVPLNELFCIEKGEFSFGGSWNRDFINYLEINLFLCQNGVTFDSLDPRCSKMVDFIKKINSSLSFEFFYPVVQFQPTNYKIPMSLIYKNYNYKLSTDSYKNEKLYIREHILSDDRNIIRSNPKNISCWGLSALYGNDYYVQNEINSILKINSSKIYTLEIYLDDGLIYYTRKYKNIFLIISNVFPIFRFVLYFFKKFSQHVKISIIKRRLTGLIFENKDQEKKERKKNIGEIVKLSNKIIIESNKSKDELMKDMLKDSNENNKDKIINNMTKNNNFILNTNSQKDKDIDNNAKSNINLNIQNINATILLNQKDVSLTDKNNKSMNELLKENVFQKNYFLIIIFFLILFLINLYFLKNFFVFLEHILQYIILCVKYMIYQHI